MKPKTFRVSALYINMKKNKQLEVIKGIFFWRGWHPEVALRYLPVVDEIKRLGNKPSVLDVGSGGLGIAPYIGFSVTGIDVRFKPPFHENLERVKASAVKIPFADNVYDAVVSVDAFEHLTVGQRKKAVKEMIRCAKKLIVVAVPSGEKSYIQDKELSKYYRKKFGKKYHFFEEQLHLGLPEEKDIIEAVNNASKELNIKIKMKILNNENLSLREFLMKGWMTRNFFIDILFRKVMLLFIPLFVYLNNPPVYRKIFIIKKI